MGFFSWRCIFLCYFYFALLTVTQDVSAQETSETLQEKARRFHEMLKHDGVQRSVVMTDKNYASLIRKRDIVVSLFHVEQSGNSNSSAQERHLLEVVAQVFGGKVLSTVCNMIENGQATQRADIKYAGVIRVFNQGKPSFYNGQRSPDVMVPYVSKLFESPVSVINTKTEKKQCDGQELPKVVAYVGKDSKEWKVLSLVARYFQPLIPFYSVSDPKIAKSLHLRKLNSLQIIKPFEKPMTMPSKITWSEKDIVQFVEDNRKEVLQKLRLENVHEVWSVDSRGFVAPIFATGSQPEGKRFLTLAKALARSFKSTENIRFVWVDPETFPAMGTHWQEAFGVDPNSPTIGAIEMATQKSAWKAVPDVDGKAAAATMKQWVVDLLAGKVELSPAKPTASDEESSESAVPDEEESAAHEEQQDDVAYSKQEL